eukprot:128772-Heterocapsa_arctica.AAC.1
MKADTSWCRAGRTVEANESDPGLFSNKDLRDEEITSPRSPSRAGLGLRPDSHQGLHRHRCGCPEGFEPWVHQPGQP